MQYLDTILTKLNGVKGKRLGLVIGLAILFDAFTGVGLGVTPELKWPAVVLCVGYMLAEGMVDIAKVIKGQIPATGTGTIQPVENDK